MTDQILLEPAAHAFAEAAARSPLLFTLGPEQGRLASSCIFMALGGSSVVLRRMTGWCANWRSEPGPPSSSRCTGSARK